MKNIYMKITRNNNMCNYIPKAYLKLRTSLCAASASLRVPLLVALVMFIYAACDEMPRPPQYTCANGTVASGVPAGNGDVERCTECTDGYHLENGVCVANVYNCGNGTAAAPTTAGVHDTELCVVCNFNYVFNDSDNTCRQPIYTCDNGNRLEDITPPANRDIMHCATCVDGYYLDGIECMPNSYTCPQGTRVMDGTEGGNDDEEFCARCNPGFGLTSDNTCIIDSDGDGVADSEDVDVDNDGLIEINDINMLHNIRYNLSGTSYDDEFDDSTGNEGDTTGAPTTSENTECETDTDGDGAFLCGYELTGDLDFTDEDDYADNIINNRWRPDHPDPDLAGNPGWPGIGDSSTAFSALFEGNSYTISNLYRRENNYVGLFNRIGSDALVRNIGVIDAAVYSNVTADEIGVLIGENNGTVIASHASGSGFVNAGGNIAAGFSLGSMDKPDSIDKAGGLVGENNGTIIASYATTDVEGGNYRDAVGGLAGLNSGTIIASYATGNVDGDESGTIDPNATDLVGGLVGINQNGTIIASYATGLADGGESDDAVGGLVGGRSDSLITIIASYAIGDVNGGSGGDAVGALVSTNGGVTNTNSYGFGTATGGDVNAGLPDGFTASEFTLQIGDSEADDYAGDAWNDADSNTLNAWLIEDDTVTPALRYADYDGAGDVYDCDMFPDTIPGTETTLECDTATDTFTLLPGQRN